MNLAGIGIMMRRLLASSATLLAMVASVKAADLLPAPTGPHKTRRRERCGCWMSACAAASALTAWLAGTPSKRSKAMMRVACSRSCGLASHFLRLRPLSNSSGHGGRANSRLPGGLPVISPSFATGSEDSRPRRTTRGQPERGNGSLGKRKPVLPLAGTITRARILRIEQPPEVKH